MKKLNVNRLKMQIEGHFSYFDKYKQFEYLQSLDESTDNLKYSFSESHVRFLYKLEEKKYNYEERKTIVKKLITEKKKIIELKNIGTVLVLLCNPDFNLIPRKIEDELSVKVLLPVVFDCRNENAVIFTQEELSEPVLMQFLCIPFLFSYMDVYFLPFGQKFFYYCNHHLDLFQVDYEIKK